MSATQFRWGSASTCTQGSKLRSATPGRQAGPKDLLEPRLSVPVLFRPAPHFFLGLGPSILQNWTPWGDAPFDRQYLEYGVRSSIGGYFDL